MMMNDKSTGMHDSSNLGKQAKNPSLLSSNQVQTRAIMRMTMSDTRQDKIKKSFKDKDDNKIQEYIDTYHNDDRKENLLVLEGQLLLLRTH